MHSTVTVIAAAAATFVAWLGGTAAIDKLFPPEPWVVFTQVSAIPTDQGFDIIYTAEKARDCRATVEWVFVTKTNQDLVDGRGGPVGASLNHRQAGPDPHVFTIPVQRPAGHEGEALGYRATVTPDDPNCGKPVTAQVGWMPG